MFIRTPIASSILSSCAGKKKLFVSLARRSIATGKVDDLATRIAEKYRRDVERRVEDFTSPRHLSSSSSSLHPRPAPLLRTFLATSDPSAQRYIRSTARSCERTGIRFDTEIIPDDPIALDAAVSRANEDPDVHGIMIYYPVGLGKDFDKYLRNRVDPRKDVEGLCETHRRNMFGNVRWVDEGRREKATLPCTPLAIVKILEHVGVYKQTSPLGDRLFGSTVTVINRSDVVGRPLAAMLANDGAKVYSVDDRGIHLYSRHFDPRMTRYEIDPDPDVTLDRALSESDVVVSGVSDATFRIETHRLKEGAVAIDLTRGGNFDRETIERRAAVFLPNVGPVTVAMLQRNLLDLAFQNARLSSSSSKSSSPSSTFDPSGSMNHLRWITPYPQNPLLIPNLEEKKSALRDLISRREVFN